MTNSRRRSADACQRSDDAVRTALKAAMCGLRAIFENQFGDKFPDDVVNALARMLLPEIQKAYESAEGQAEFEKWKAEQADSQTDKHNEK